MNMLKPITKDNGALDPWAIAGWLVTTLVAVLTWLMLSVIDTQGEHADALNDMSVWRSAKNVEMVKQTELRDSEARTADAMSKVYAEIAANKREYSADQRMLSEQLIRLSEQMTVVSRSIEELKVELRRGKGQ